MIVINTIFDDEPILDEEFLNDLKIKMKIQKLQKSKFTFMDFRIFEFFYDF